MVQEPNSEILSLTAERLLRTAQNASLSGLPCIDPDDTPAALSEFLQIYREWITAERGAFGTQREQADQWQMLVHCMAAGATIDAAIRLFIRFAPVVWGERAPIELRDEGGLAALVFREPFRAGSEGLIAAIWMLSLTFCTLIFLAGVRFQGVSGRVMHPACLPEGVARLLFDAPIAYGEDEVALLIPRHHLQSPVVVRAVDLPEFFRKLLPLTLGVRRKTPSLATMVAGLIRDDKQGPIFRQTDRANVAARLGLSESTIRRRLADEGVTFREIRNASYNDLARQWLGSQEVSVEEIADRLGFSDSFAFRRFFHRQNGCSPRTWRKIWRGDLATAE